MMTNEPKSELVVVRLPLTDEQAFVLFWLLGLVLEHGKDWRPYAGEQLQALRRDIMGSLERVVRDGRERSALADGWFAEISRLATAELRAENERLREALELLVADCQQYPAWERPCFALDVAEAGLRGEDHSPERTLPDNVAATLSAIPQAPDGRTDRDISDDLKANMFWEAADPEGSTDSAEGVIERHAPFTPVQMETAFLGPNIWGYHDGARNFVFATEAECLAAIDATDWEGQGDV